MTIAGRASTTTILYVEDDAVNQELMRSVIRKRPGVRLVIAGLGADAIEAAVAERPSLILLDRHLPDMTGEEVLRLLRAREETQAVPVVVVSGDTATTRPGEAALDVIGYLTKPIDIPELLSYIDRVLGPHGPDCSGRIDPPADTDGSGVIGG